MSKRWLALGREISALRTQFLPDPFHPLGVYSNSTRVQAHTRAFLVLSHAELESYLEEWAKEIARASESVWTRSSRIAPPLAFLLSSLAQRFSVPTTLSGLGAQDTPERLAEVVTRLFQTYYKKIKDNNGVKEKNVLALFGPLGVASAAFNATLLPNLDALGAIRGTHVHYSAKAVMSMLDPETEHKRIIDILTDLVVLDDWLLDYKRKIR